MISKLNKIGIGQEYPVFFIAEAGVNHNGSLDIGLKLVEIAAKAGASAVKFQSFVAENIVTKESPKSSYHIETTGTSEKQTWYDLLKTQEMSRSMHKSLIKHCNLHNILFMSTPYDEESVDLLRELDVPIIKVASTDTSNIPFLRYIAATGIPTILSSAMATLQEVSDAISIFQEAGTEHGILQCTGNYPAKLSNSNLKVIHQYRDLFNCPVGYSDHTMEMINPIAATAIGADIYEKHFTVDRGLQGPDHRMSLLPSELAETITNIRLTELALGDGEKKVVDEEIENRDKLRKSVVSVKSIFKGQTITPDMLAIKRPAFGIPPKDYQKILYRTALRDIEADELITYEMISIS